MSRLPPPVTEEDLHALVDGEADPARRDAIFSFLSGSPADAAKVESWRRQNEAIRAWFGRIEPEPFELPWSVAPATRQRLSNALSAQTTQPGAKTPALSLLSWRKKRFWQVAKSWRNLTARALLIGFLSGVGTAYGLMPLLDQARVAGSHGEGPVGTEADAAFISRTKAALLDFGSAGEPAAARQGASSAALILPNLSGSGLRLTGVRVVPGEKDRMICLFYTKAAAGAIALCAEPKGEDAKAGFHETDQSPHRTIWWTQNRAKYALSGALPDAELRSLADHARTEIEAFDSH